MKTFNFNLVDGVMIAEIDGHKVLIDTGSPVTLGGPCDLPSFGSPVIRQSIPGGYSVPNIGNLLEHGFDVLCGCDVLARQPFLVNWRARTITFKPENPPDGIVIPLSTVGIPIISARIGDLDYRLALDTGAKVTFLNPNLTNHDNPVGVIDDFHVTCGKFQCPSFEKTVSVGQVAFNLTCGALPASLASQLDLIQADGILGNDIYNFYERAVYDLSEHTLTLCDQRSPS